MTLNNSRRCSDNAPKRSRGALERFGGYFHGAAYSPHRHDTYAIGVTLRGVQTFDYRGATRHSQPGEMVILHPDELHDGRAGTDDGFGYRTLYVRPSEIQGVLGGRPLPFIEGGISTDVRLSKVLIPLLGDLERDLTTLEYEDAIYDLATVLSGITTSPRRGAQPDYVSASKARHFLDENLSEPVSLGHLEQISGQNRWQLSRDFRSLFGTSPYRYLVQRRLEKARDMMRTQTSIARIAIECGFSDQSHLGRHFKKAFGLSPQKWRMSVEAL